MGLHAIQGSAELLFLLKCMFWWPTVENYVRSYVFACSVCSSNKSSFKSPTVLFWGFLSDAWT